MYKGQKGPKDAFNVCEKVKKTFWYHDLFIFCLRWLPRVFTNNASYLASVTERNLVTLSLRFCSRDSLLRLPI